MAKDVKKKFTISLDISTDEAEKQVKMAADNIKKTFAKMGDATDKMSVLKDVVGYIGQIDQALDVLQAKGGTFSHLFDGIDVDLKKILENIFGVTGESMAALDQLKAKVAAVKLNGNITGDELKPLEQEVKSLYASLNMLDKAGISGKGKIETRLAKLEASLENFGVVFEGVNAKIKGDLKLGGVGDDEILPYLKEQNAKIQEEIKKMQKVAASYKEVWDILHGKKRVKNITDENAVQVLDQLNAKYLQAAEAAEKLKNAEGEASENYKKQAMQAIRYAALLKNTMDKSSEDSEVVANWALKYNKNNSYDNLTQFLQSMSGSDTAKSVAEYVKQQITKVNAQITSLKTGEMAQSATAGFNTITKGADNASKAIQKVMYHLGNLLNGKGKKQDTFDEMPYNLTGAVAGNDKYEKYGFGVLGGGCFGVSDPSMIDQKDVVSSKLIHGIDLSKYNMYMADTEERAVALMDFLSKFQKYAMKQAEPDYKGFDDQLDGVNMDILYDQFKVVFNESDLTKEKLNSFLTDMVGLLRQAGLKFDEGLNELVFTSIGDLEGSENISTRLMKMLGYHGVNVGGTSFDGFGQGSVLFDFKESDLVSYFNNVGQAVDDFNKRINDANWDGTNEQLKQYRANIDDIIARLQEYEQKYQIPSITKNVNDTISKLTQTKSVIDQLLSGNSSGGLETTHEEATNNKSLKEKLKLVKQIGNAYERFAVLQIENDGSAEFEEAKDEIKDFEDKYHSLIATLSDGTKIKISLGLDEVDEKIETLMKDSDKIQNIDFVPKEAGAAVDAYEKIDLVLTNIGKQWKNLDTVERAVGSVYPDSLESWLKNLEGAIKSIEALDPNFQYGTKEGYDSAVTTLGKLQELSNRTKLTESFSDVVNQFEQLGKFKWNNDINNGYIDILTEIRNGTYTTVDQCVAKFEELTTSVKVTEAYNDVFDVLSKISDKWKDLDTVDSAIGSMPLSDIDAYIQKLESLIKLIESVDPNFQHGDKNEYDGAVKTLEKMKELSARTKLTDEFKNTINQFEQLGKFQWSDELTNGYVKILGDIRNGTYKTIGQCVAKFNELSAAAAEPPLMDTQTAFKELINYISKSGSSPSSFFDKMESGALQVNDALKQIFKSLNLIDEKGNVTLSSLKSGFTNKGGFVSDQYTMIARPDYYIGKIQSIQPKLQQAQKEGAQIGAIIDIIEDKAKGLIYEIQNTVPGKSVLGHHSGKTNQDALAASDAHIEGLINTLQILAKNGLFVDWGGDNVLYDPQKGFSIIDFGDKGDKHFTVSSKNTIQENLDRMITEMLKYASLDMKNAIQSNFADKLYSSAQKIDSTVVNPYAPKQQKAVQTASTQVAAAVKSESDVHDQNTASINAENDALKAQIELKKQAQSMKWEAFATDDSLSALKQSAGMQTLGQLEAFWKKSNYEKNINFHEISEAEAKQIFKDKLSKGLASAWYGSADFTAKSKLENEILADDEVRNAAMSFLYNLYKKMPISQQNPNVKDFNDFINTEFTVYRGDKSPLIYDDQSKLSFSFKESTAQGFNSQLGTAKIKPKDTIGNAGSGFYSEVETFINSYETSWYQKNREAFEDFYNNQTKEMQKEIDAGLVNFEKKRVSDIIGDDLSTLTHKAGKDSYWQQSVASHISQGVIPDQLDVLGDDSDYDKFAIAYNGLSDTMKRFVMFYASMDELSASLPKQFSLSIPTANGGSYKYGKNAVGDGAKLFNAILNDPEGRNQHIAKLTGEQAFNLMGVTPAEINAVADAHKNNTQAINAEAQAQKDLNSLQERYDMVMDDLWDSAVDADGSKSSELSNLWSQLHDVQHSDQDLVNQGAYKQKSSGDSVQATDLFQLVVDIESKYNENLDYVKDYLKQVYAGIDFSGIIPQDATSNTHADFDATKTQVYETAKTAYKSGNQKKYFKILGMLNHLTDIDVARSEDIANAEYEYNDSGRYYNISHLVEMVNRIESAYQENFDYVYDYLKQVYGEATIDDALAKISGDSASRPAKPQYTTLDYENVYSQSPADMQAAIDDLAVFQQRYEQLYALTNTQPIEFLFPGKPTLNEVEEVITVFDQFKAKQREIFQLQLLDYEGNKEKIQELQAEAVGLQNKLLNASLGEDADIAEYKLTYGFTSDQDADRFKKLVDMTESVHTVMNDLSRIGEQKMSLIPQAMQDMLDADSGDAAERFMAQQAKKVQSAKAAAQQADASAAASKQQLQTEQDITAEKQRQASIDDRQAAQATTDATQNQNVQAEVAALETLNQKIEQVKFAVALKTSAFEQEAVTVNKVVNEEIVALEKLKTLLTEIQNSLQIVFAANNWNIGDVNLSQDKTSSSSMPNILGEIKSLLGQIYGVLSKSTGVEADNKNSAQVKTPVVDNKAIDSDAYKALAAKIPDDIAKDGTLQQILAAVNIIAKKPTDSDNADLTNLSAAIIAAATELKSVANGIVQHQKTAKSDTSVAQARIANKDSYVQIKSAALGSLGDRALDSEVTEMQALSNGIVKVTGWLKVAEDAWEGFTVQVNEANEASKLAFSTNSKAAKQAAAQAKKIQVTSDDDDLNTKKYSKQETEALAQQKIAEYTKQGKVATVQFKDSGRYTITILDQVDGLAKQIFQTFDENNAMIERTTATMSNAALVKIQDLQRIAQFGFENDLIGDGDKLYQDFQKASLELEAMNYMYSQAGQLSDDQIANWKLQIQLVTKLGNQVQKLVAQNKNPEINTKVNKKAYGATPILNAQAKFNTLESRAKPYAENGWSDISNAYQQYATALKNLINLQSQFNNGQDPTDAQKIQFVQLKDACNAASKELKRLLDTADAFNQKVDKSSITGVAEDINVENRNSRGEALKAYVQDMYGSQAVIRGLNADMTELEFTIKNTDGTVEHMTAAFNSAKTQMGILHGEVKKAVTVWDLLGNKIGELWRYALARMGVDDIIRYVKQGVQYVQEIDTALTELKKVTNETDETYNNFLQTMSKTAGAVGSTVKDLVSSAADWGRLGYSLEEAGALAEITAKLLNVSEFESVDDATSALVSSLQAFANDGQSVAVRAEEIVDILNNIGNKYPVATNELADGLATSSAALVAANNSIEEQVALLAAGNATMQDVSTVASGLKIVAARLRGTTTDDDDDADSAITNVSKLQKKIKELTKDANGGEGIDIINEKGEYKSTYEILTEISKIFDKMDDMSSASLLELIAGE